MTKKVVLEYNNAHPGQVFLIHQEGSYIQKEKKRLEALGYEVELKGKFMGYTPMLDKLGLTGKLLKCSTEQLEDIIKEFGKGGKILT